MAILPCKTFWDRCLEMVCVRNFKVSISKCRCLEMVCVRNFKVKKFFHVEITGIGVTKEIECFNWSLVSPGELLEFQCEWSPGGCDGSGREGGAPAVWEVAWRAILRCGPFRQVHLETRWDRHECSSSGGRHEWQKVGKVRSSHAVHLMFSFNRLKT